MFVWFLIFFAAVSLLIGLLILKLIERAIYEHYKQSVPWEKINISEMALGYYYIVYSKSTEYFKKYIMNNNNTEKVNGWKIKAKKYINDLLTRKN